MNRRAAVGLVLAGAILASVWVVIVYSGDRSPADVATPTEESARYYPDDVVAYAWLTLVPSGGQYEDMAHLGERLYEFGGIRDLVDDADGVLLDAIGSNFADIRAWVRTEMSAAVFDLGNGDLGVAVTVGVSDRDSAGEFLVNWIERWEGETSTSFERHMVDDHVIWEGDGNDWMGSHAYAEAGDVLVFATDSDILEDVLDRVDGTGAGTLATSRNFTEARSAAPDRRFASVFVDSGRLSELAGGGRDEGSCLGGSFTIPDWLMASATWIDRGLVIDLVTPALTSRRIEASANAAAAVVPADALGFISIVFDPDVDRWREVLGECAIADLILDGDLIDWPWAEDGMRFEDGSTLADALDRVLGMVDLGIGLDLEHDLLDHLGGELVVAVHDTYMEKALPEGVAVLSYRPDGEDAIEATMDALTGRIASLTGVTMEQVDVGADNTGTMIEGGQLSLGYVLHDGHLTLGTSEASLENTMAVQKGAADRISDSEEYQRTVGHITYRPQLLAYADPPTDRRQEGPRRGRESTVTCTNCFPKQSAR